MSDPIISVRGLRNSFGEQIIHDDLDIDVQPGEILGVVGGSGTGKSVLMRSIIGLQEPEAGEINVFGESMRGKEEDEATDVRRRWGVLFQGAALFSTLTVAENSNIEQFKSDLKAHQQGQTDYMTFCNDCAQSGVEKWIVCMEKMTCAYYDKAGKEMLVEIIPG